MCLGRAYPWERCDCSPHSLTHVWTPKPPSYALEVSNNCLPTHNNTPSFFSLHTCITHTHIQYIINKHIRAIPPSLIECPVLAHPMRGVYTICLLVTHHTSQSIQITVRTHKHKTARCFNTYRAHITIQPSVELTPTLQSIRKPLLAPNCSFITVTNGRRWRLYQRVMEQGALDERADRWTLSSRVEERSTGRQAHR